MNYIEKKIERKTSIEKKKSNKAIEEGNFALPNISAIITIFYFLIPNILEYIYIYINVYCIHKLITTN